jgi:hypothetical protein
MVLPPPPQKSPALQAAKLQVTNCKLALVSIIMVCFLYGIFHHTQIQEELAAAKAKAKVKRDMGIEWFNKAKTRADDPELVEFFRY